MVMLLAAGSAGLGRSAGCRLSDTSVGSTFQLGLWPLPACSSVMAGFLSRFVLFQYLVLFESASVKFASNYVTFE